MAFVRNIDWMRSTTFGNATNHSLGFEMPKHTEENRLVQIRVHIACMIAQARKVRENVCTPPVLMSCGIAGVTWLKHAFVFELHVLSIDKRTPQSLLRIHPKIK
jgi:hypothetical protein